MEHLSKSEFRNQEPGSGIRSRVGFANHPLNNTLFESLSNTGPLPLNTLSVEMKHPYQSSIPPV